MNGKPLSSGPLNPNVTGACARFTPTDRAANIDAIKLPRRLQDWCDKKHLTEEENRRRWTTVPGQRSTKIGPRGLNMAKGDDDE
jgi:hypothetical protein